MAMPPPSKTQILIPKATAGRTQRVDGALPTIGFLYVHPDNISSEQAEEYLCTLQKSFVSSASHVFGRYEASMTSYTIDIEVLHKQEGDAAIEKLKKERPEVLIAILDTDGLKERIAKTDEQSKTGPTNEQRESKFISDIRATIYNLGHNTIGALTSCTEKWALEKSEFLKKHYPRLMLQKIKLMNGGLNFDLDPAVGWPPEKRIMVVGAHVSHPEDPKHRSSVAAVVASTDPQLTRYPGSIRMQATHRKHEDGERKKGTYVQSRIIELESMMIERFDLWKRSNRRLVPGVVFYREGLIEPSWDIVVREMEAIQNAFNKVFKSAKQKLAASYVIVHKSGNGGSGPQWKELRFRADSFAFSTSNSTSLTRPTQYTYHVFRDFAGLHKYGWKDETYEKLVYPCNCVLFML